MPAIRWTLALVAALALCACIRRQSHLSRHHEEKIGNSVLIEQYKPNRGGPEHIVVHVLYVPAVALTGGWSSSATRANGEDRSQYVQSWTVDGKTISAAPIVVIRQLRVETGGRSYDLRDGNIFVVAAGPKGSTVRQLLQVMKDRLSRRYAEQLIVDAGPQLNEVR